MHICRGVQEAVSPNSRLSQALSPMAAGGGAQHHEPTGLVSMRELLDQIDTNQKHLMRSISITSAPELLTAVSSGSPRALSIPTYLPPVRELDNDPDTFVFLCLPFPVITLQGLRRRTWSCINNLLWTRPPLPCVVTTCGPIHHVRSCEFHPLSGALPYKMPIRRSTSLPSVNVQGSKSPLRSSSSLPAPSASNSPSTSTASNSPSTSAASNSPQTSAASTSSSTWA